MLQFASRFILRRVLLARAASSSWWALCIGMAGALGLWACSGGSHPGLAWFSLSLVPLGQRAVLAEYGFPLLGWAPGGLLGILGGWCWGVRHLPAELRPAALPWMIALGALAYGAVVTLACLEVWRKRRKVAATARAVVLPLMMAALLVFGRR